MAEKITMGADGVLSVPVEPIIPFIEGDGTGVDIWPAARRVLDAAAAKHGRTIAWKEVLAGEKAFNETGSWLPGVPSPVRRPELVDMVIFRENTEDVYAGYEVEAGTPEAEKLAAYLRS